VPERATSRAAVVFGVFFIVVGVVFLLERLEAIDLELALLAPTFLIALGIAIVLGGRAGR
jgi:hypothetical protein